MAWLTLISSVLLSVDGGPSTVVLVSRRTAVPQAEAQALAIACSTRLKEAGVPIAIDPEAALKQLARVSVKDSASCNGRRACIAELGRQLNVEYVVALSVATMNRDTSLGLELIRIADETGVEKDSLILPRKSKPNADALASFAGRVKAVVAPAPPEVVKPPDTPKEVALVPVDPPPPPPVEVVTAAPRTHTTSWILGGAGVVAVAASATLFALAMSSRGQLEQGPVGADGRIRSTLTGSQAQAANAGSSAMIGAAAGAAAVGLGLGTAAVLTW